MRRFVSFQAIKNIHKRLLYIVSVVVLAVSMPASAFAAPTFTNHSLSSGFTNPGQATSAGGSLWYLETTTAPNTSYYIGNMTSTGTTTDYNVRTLSGDGNLILRSLTTGSDGNVWFNAISSTSIYAGVLNISTGTITLYSSGILSYGDFGTIVAGSGGNLWYYVKNATNNKYYLVYLNPSTGTTTTAYMSDTFSAYTSTASDSTGKIWVTDTYYNRVYSFDGSGMLSSYTVPTSSSSPDYITAGPDGNLWFVETANYKITKLTTGGTFTEYGPTTGVYPRYLTAGPDGAVWFIDTNNKVGRITSAGSITEYTIPGSTLSGYAGMTLGPDNAMWFSYKDSVGPKLGSITTTPFFDSYALSSGFTNPGQATSAGGSLWYLETTTSTPSATYHIGSMTTSGTTTDYDIRTLSGNSSLALRSVTTGPDGNVWFNASSGTSVYEGFLNISTGTVTLYSSGILSYGDFGSIVASPDGNLWYYIKNASNNKYYVVYVNPSTGTATTAYISDTFSNYTSTTSGPGSKVWITDTYYNRVYSFNTSGMYSTSTIPTANSYPTSIAAGSDGNLWFVELNNGKVAKLTTSRVFTEYTPPSGYGPAYLAAGPDSAVWFINGGKIGSISGSGVFTGYTIPGTSLSGFNGLTLGPDNAMWFSYKDSVGPKLGRLGY